MRISAIAGTILLANAASINVSLAEYACYNDEGVSSSPVCPTGFMLSADQSECSKPGTPAGWTKNRHPAGHWKPHHNTNNFEYIAQPGKDVYKHKRRNRYVQTRCSGSTLGVSFNYGSYQIDLEGVQDWCASRTPAQAGEKRKAQCQSGSTLLAEAPKTNTTPTPKPPSNVSYPEEYFESMQCGQGERKVLVKRGYDDNFAQGNPEVSEMSGPVSDLDHFKVRPITGYDSTAWDKHFLDHATLPENISSGYVMLAMKAISGNANDNIQIGDLASVYNNLDDIDKQLTFSSRINELTAKGWLKSGNHYSSSLANLPYRTGNGTVLDLVKGKAAPVIVDVHVQDDTAVDYVVFGLCVGPKLEWTEWLDRDDPDSKGDYETIAGHRQNGNGCEAPAAIECRTVSGRDWVETGENYTCDTERGGRCINREQRDGRCEDYEIRLLCPAP